jgi:hypothetical protein
LRTLRIRGTVDVSLIRAPLLDAVDPPSGLGGVPASNNCDSKIGNGEQDSADCFLRQRPFVDGDPLQEQVRPRGRPPKAAHLSPKLTTADRQVQPPRRFPLDGGNGSDYIVAGPEMSLGKLDAKRMQRTRHSAGPLVDVNPKLNPQRVPREVPQNYAAAVPITSTSDFADA